MAASNISIQLVNNAEPLLAYAKVPLTLYNKSHVIVELKVLGGERGPWVALPQRKEGDGWVPIISIPEDLWEKVKYAVLLAYNTKIHSQPSSKQAEKQEQIPPNFFPNKVRDLIKRNTKENFWEQLPVSELIKLQPRRRIPLPDRQERIAFLEQKYGKTYRGKAIKYMTNRQLYAISTKCGYR